jgi:hypothetical protein
MKMAEFRGFLREYEVSVTLEDTKIYEYQGLDKLCLNRGQVGQERS